MLLIVTFWYIIYWESHFFMYITPSLNHFVSNRPSDFRGMLIKEDLKG